MTPQELVAALDPTRRRELDAITRMHGTAWPTVALCVILVTGVATSDVLALTGVIPLWAGLVANSLLGYLAFSVAHDAIHRAVCRNTRVNDWIGQIAVLMIAPYVHLGLFRWGHVQHHRFAVSEKDPDRVFRGPWWQLPLRWSFIDLAYFREVMRSEDPRARRFLRHSLWMLAVTVILVVALTAAGYGWELLLLWFLPSRLVQMMLGFSFFWLPHVPHEVSQAENFTRATTMRLGQEWLLGPLLQYQNYHLMHHLFPTTPFYRHARLWRLVEPELRSAELAIQNGFAIRPTIHAPATQRAA